MSVRHVPPSLRTRTVSAKGSTVLFSPKLKSLTCVKKIGKITSIQKRRKNSILGAAITVSGVVGGSIIGVMGRRLKTRLVSLGSITGTDGARIRESMNGGLRKISTRRWKA